MPFSLTKGLLDRIRTRVKKELSGLGFGHKPGDEAEDRSIPRELIGPASDAPTLMYRIRYAARTRTLLWMKYNNTWRHVEPYSFRYRSRGMQPLFYGFCQLHSTIEAYRIDRIQDLHITDRPFTPRWAIEVA